MKILLTDKEKLDLIYSIIVSINYYYEENNCLLHWNDKEYEISKKVAKPQDDSYSSTICYEDVLMSLLNKGYDIILIDDYAWSEDEEVEVLGRYNLKEIFYNLDNLPLNSNYYDDENSVAKDILDVFACKDDSYHATRLMSIIFPLHITTRK
jgi:hypothetical protein